MIRSTKTTTKFSNKTKLNDINSFVDEYRKVVLSFVDLLWNVDKIPTLLPKEYTSKIDSWLGARAIQSAAKQASGIVRGTQLKQKQRLYKIEQLKKENLLRKARTLQRIYNETQISKPNINEVCPELDSRFVKIDLKNDTSFDGWLTLTCLGNKLKIIVPFKKTKHFNKLLSKGVLKSGIRLSKHNITFNFDINVKEKTSGSTLGIDIGQNTILSCSNGTAIDKDKHGWNYRDICEKLARKKKNSIAFKKAQRHRTNYIGWSINQLNLNNIKQVNIENIKNLRKYKTSSRTMSHWNYRELFGKLGKKLDELGVQIVKLSPTFTSQRCSRCGWVRENNRQKKLFKCGKCGHTADADLNASINLSLNLVSIDYKERSRYDNKIGFYWNTLDQERIVPDALKTSYFS